MSEALTIAIITILAGAIGTIGWYVIRRFSEKITEKIDELIKAVNELSTQMISNTNHISQNSDQLKDHSDRLSDHSKRIRTLELKQAHCKNCTE